MEKKTNKSQAKYSSKIVILSVISSALIVISYLKGPELIERSTQAIYERFLSKITLEKIEWKESYETNLSGYVNEKLLFSKSGIKLHEPMVDQDVDLIEMNLKSIPWISRVQISTRLPNKLLIEYELYQARAMVIQNMKPWFVSSDGYLISEVKKDFHGDHRLLELPLLSNFINNKDAVEWLNVLETELMNSHIQIHEIVNEFSQVSALIEMQYDNKNYKVTLIIPETGKNNPGKLFTRFNQVAEYLIKNNILVSTIDLRAGQKIVVNVGKNL